MDFQYGSGNRSLTSVGGATGCPVTTATIGLSNGHETAPQVSGTLSGSGSLENALSLIYMPPYPALGVPLITLESPVDGDTVHGVLTGKGIVYDVEPSVPVRRMDVLVDGVALTTATLNVSRADYCAADKVPACPYVGFTFSVPVAFDRLPAGKHTLQLRATNARGVTNTAPETPITFNVEAGESTQPVARLETPAAGATVSDVMSIRGYVGLPDAKVRYVDVLIDGITYTAATFGSSRADVCSTLPSGTTLQDCPRIGFSAAIDTTSQDTSTLMLSNGPHTIQVRGSGPVRPVLPVPGDAAGVHGGQPGEQAAGGGARHRGAEPDVQRHDQDLRYRL